MNDSRTTITVYISDAFAMGGCDPAGFDVEATCGRLAGLCRSALAAAYPDAVVISDAWTEYALSATGTPRWRVTIPREGMLNTDDQRRIHQEAEEEMEADVQRICLDTWGLADHWVLERGS
mgnify:FL=1